MFFSPNSPVGLTIRTMIRRTNVNAFANVVHPKPLMIFSQIPIMKNTHTVYAGLTYGKGYLNETYDPLSQQSRGFKA